MFARLSTYDQEALRTLGAVRAFEPGECIMAEGTRPTHVVILLSGTAVVTTVSVDGQEVFLASRSAGDLLGEMSVLGDTERSASVWARSRVRCRVIGADQYLDFLERHPKVLLEQLRELVRRLRESGTSLVDQRRGLEERVTLRLVDLAERSGDTTLRITQSDLAQEVGATRESVARVLAELRARGLVRTGRGRVEILDLRRLAETRLP